MHVLGDGMKLLENPTPKPPDQVADCWLKLHQAKTPPWVGRVNAVYHGDKPWETRRASNLSHDSRDSTLLHISCSHMYSLPTHFFLPDTDNFPELAMDKQVLPVLLPNTTTKVFQLHNDSWLNRKIFLVQKFKNIKLNLIGNCLSIYFLNCFFF